MTPLSKDAKRVELGTLMLVFLVEILFLKLVYAFISGKHIRRIANHRVKPAIPHNRREAVWPIPIKSVDTPCLVNIEQGRQCALIEIVRYERIAALNIVR